MPNVIITKILKRLNGLKIKETIGVVRVISLDQWVLQYAIELKTLKISQLQQKFQISSGQVDYRRNLLKKLKQKETQRVAQIQNKIDSNEHYFVE